MATSCLHSENAIETLYINIIFYFHSFFLNWHQSWSWNPKFYQCQNFNPLNTTSIHSSNLRLPCRFVWVRSSWTISCVINRSKADLRLLMRATACRVGPWVGVAQSLLSGGKPYSFPIERHPPSRKLPSLRTTQSPEEKVGIERFCKPQKRWIYMFQHM